MKDDGDNFLRFVGFAIWLVIIMCVLIAVGICIAVLAFIFREIGLML